MADKDKRVQVSVLLDPETHQQAKIAAIASGNPKLTRWIEALIRKALEKGRKKAA